MVTHSINNLLWVLSMLYAKISIYLMLSFTHPTSLLGLSLSCCPSPFWLWIPCSSVIIIHLQTSTSSLFSTDPCETSERTEENLLSQRQAHTSLQLAPMSAFLPVPMGELSVLTSALTFLPPQFRVLLLTERHCFSISFLFPLYQWFSFSTESVFGIQT